MYWFREGEDDSVTIESDEKYEVLSQNDNHTLEIYNITKDDHGQYLCLVKNDTASSHWLFGLRVEGTLISTNCTAVLIYDQDSRCRKQCLSACL